MSARSPPPIARITRRVARSVLQGYDPVEKYTKEATEKYAADFGCDSLPMMIKGVRRARQLYESPNSLVVFVLPEFDPEWQEVRPEACARLSKLLCACTLLASAPIEMIPAPPPSTALVHLDLVLIKDRLSQKAIEPFKQFAQDVFPLAQMLDQRLKTSSRYIREQILSDLCSRKQSLLAVGYKGKALNVWQISKAAFDQMMVTNNP